MKARCHFPAVAAALALLAPASAERPIPGDFSGRFDPTAVLQTPAPVPGEMLAFDMNRLVTQQTRLLRYQATEQQRKVAAARARAFVAAHRAAEKSRVPQQTEPKLAKTAKKEPKPRPATTAKKEPEPKPAKKAPAEEPKVAAKPKPLPRYIAVDTVKDKRASPRARKVVMIWDTQAETLVGNNLYDVENPPMVGATAKFETYTAEYIGAGH